MRASNLALARVRRCGPIAAVLFAVACAGTPPRPGELPAVSTKGGDYVDPLVVLPRAPVETVSSVEVHLAESLPADKENALQELGGTEALAQTLERSLSANRRFDPRSEHALHLTLTGFGLRSGFNVVMMGSMIGGDTAEGVVSVWRSGELIQRYPIGAQSLRGGMYSNVGSGGRFQLLSNDVAVRVLAGL